MTQSLQGLSNSEHCLPSSLSRSCFQLRVRHHVGKFFFAGRDAHHSRDHLVLVVQRDPLAAARFIKSVSLFSIAGNCAVGVACAVFLSLHWTKCGFCDRPLRWWLLLQALFQLSQLPVRAVLLLSVIAAEQSGQGIEGCVASITAAPAWTMSKNLALAQYGWLVLGMVWWAHLESCPMCPGIGKLAVSVMLLCVARAAVALVAFRLLFWQEEPVREVPKIVAATPDTIAALPVVRFSKKACEDSDACCSICLTEYRQGDEMRRMPCGHEFHRRCIDKWLHRNRRCPLCLRPVDETLAAEEQAKKDGLRARAPSQML